MRFFFVRNLSIGSNGELPSEFRLFTSGWNETENGKFLFDEKAAQSVMSSFAKWGVDVAIDLEHQMLDGAGTDPTSRDARGWCGLELRSDGSLWAVNVRWTSDGAARLSEKRQRYVSPAFEVDPKTNRVSKIINVAITSIPATHDTPALIAASKGFNKMTKGKKALAAIKALAASGGMSSALVSKAMQALQDQDGDAALDILKAMIAEAAGGSADADGEGDPADGPDGAMPEQNSAPAGDGANPKDDNNAPASATNENDGPPAKAEKASVIAASLSSLMRMTGAKTIADAVSSVAEFHASHLELETERQKLASERATLESAERRKLCVELVTLGAEFPSTIWTDADSKTPKKRWQSMSIAELRSHVSEQRAARGGKRAPDVAPPASGDTSTISLTAEELRYCEELKCDPKVYAKLKKENPSKAGS